MSSKDDKEAEIFREIWTSLSQEDVSKYTRDRGGLTYLSWASAWGVLMKKYPGATYEFDPTEFLPDGSAMVNCRLTIKGVTREMWLPVMDYKHKAITKPNSRDVSDQRMRALTKAMAMFGLGHYIFDGEDLPRVPLPILEDINNVKQELGASEVKGFALIDKAKTVDELREIHAKNEKSWKEFGEAAFKEVMKELTKKRKEIEGKDDGTKNSE